MFFFPAIEFFYYFGSTFGHQNRMLSKSTRIDSGSCIPTIQIIRIVNNKDEPTIAAKPSFTFFDLRVVTCSGWLNRGVLSQTQPGGASMDRRQSILILLLWVCMASSSTAQDDLKVIHGKGQQLVIAAFQLDVERVNALLAEGTDPDTRLSFYDESQFEDKWTLGFSPIGSHNWTALLAVANSHRAPQPNQRAENTVAGLDASMAKLKAVDPKLIAERDSHRLTIAKLLIAAKANLDLDDGYGSTPLSSSVYSGFDDLSLLLISSNAKLDTKTSVTIDGDGDITPMHRATRSPRVLDAMIKRGAKINVADTSGSTPLHWAVLHCNVESVKRLLEAGANAAAKDKEGRSPADWCKTYDGIEFPDDKAKKEISKLLEAATKESSDKAKR